MILPTQDQNFYLVQYGRPGFLGQFRSRLALARGDRVVVRGPRGIEIGDVLVAAESLVAAAEEANDILRVASPEDDRAQSVFDRRGADLFGRACDRATHVRLPLAFVDIEVLLDGTVILHALHWSECDATSLLDELAAEAGLTVRLLDLSRTPMPVQEHGCGKPGCGSQGGGCSSCGSNGGGGGCSTGSCSRGAVKSADELTAYFADLRQKMEVAGMERKPLN